MTSSLLAQRITSIGKAPPELKLVAYQKDSNGAILLSAGAQLTAELLQENYVYAVQKNSLSIPFALRRIAKCEHPDGTVSEPGANGTVIINVQNLAGLRMLLEREKWPDRITFENVYEHYQAALEQKTRELIISLSGNREIWTWPELNEFFINTPVLGERLLDKMWLLFRKDGIEPGEPLRLNGIAPLTAAVYSTQERIPAKDEAEICPPEDKDESETVHVMDEAVEQAPEEDEHPEWMRVLLGKTGAGKKVYWEFGHPLLPNRHLLITGRSGEGKTYAIQCFLAELSRQGVPAVVFDYTDGFLPERLEPGFVKVMGGNIRQRIALTEKIPVNPFVMQQITISGQTGTESAVMAAGRFAAIMKHVYSFGDQQHMVVYSACREGMEQYGKRMSFSVLRKLIEENNSTPAKTVLSKMQQLFDLDLFDTEHALNWEEITEPTGQVTIIQLSKLNREIQTIITEILMWDCWYALVKCGRQDRPFAVVLDEAQNLSIADGSPAQKILQEGRKYGWSAWFATQFLKGALSTDELSRLYQAAETIFFHPSPEEIKQTADRLASAGIPAASWITKLDNLGKGDCIVKGISTGPEGRNRPTGAEVIHIEDLESRQCV